MEADKISNKTGDKLFVYGTLMLPELQKALLGRVVDWKPAELDGHLVYTLAEGDAETDYPVLVSRTGGLVKGKVLQGLSAAEMVLLTFYEGDEYLLKEISVQVQSGSLFVPVFYPRNNIDQFIGNPWSLQLFKRDSLAKYLSEIIPETLADFQAHL